MNKTLKVGVLSFVIFLLAGCVGSGPEKIPEPVSRAEDYQQLGQIDFKRGNYITAIEMFAKALSIYRSVDQPNGMVRAHFNVIETTLAVNKLKDARLHLQQAAHVIERDSLAHHLPRYHLLNSTVFIHEQNFSAAKNPLKNILPVFNEQQRAKGELTPIVVAAVFNRTLVAIELKDNDIDLWVKRLGFVIREIGTARHSLLGRYQRVLAAVAGLAGKTAAATQHYSNALSEYHLAFYRPGIAATLFEWGELMAANNNIDLARDRLERALHIRLWLTDARHAIEVITVLIDIETAAKNEQRVEQLVEWRKQLSAETLIDWALLRQSFAR